MQTREGPVGATRSRGLLRPRWSGESVGAVGKELIERIGVRYGYLADQLALECEGVHIRLVAGDEVAQRLCLRAGDLGVDIVACHRYGAGHGLLELSGSPGATHTGKRAAVELDSLATGLPQASSSRTRAST